MYSVPGAQNAVVEEECSVLSVQNAVVEEEKSVHCA